MMRSFLGCAASRGATAPPQHRRELRLGRPHDASERQAQRVAATLTPAILSQPVRSLTTPATVQRSGTGALADGASAPASVGDALARPGQPLQGAVRMQMERALGHDFGQVRVHADRQAAASAREIGARAYTVGQEVAFGAGQFAPQTPAGQRLLAHELTHVVQQRAGGAPPGVVQREMLYADGYKRPYKSDEAEIKKAEAGDWSPSSVDFKGSATNSGGGAGVATFAKLLTQLEGKGASSITELGLIGHANSTNFGLSGKVSGKQVWFTEPGLINAETIKANLATIQSKNLPNRFASGAKIILYGCNAGAGTGLMDAISQAFKVCVEGFKNEIDFCFKWKPAKAEKGKSRAIYGRGRASYTPPLDLTNPDPLAGLESVEKNCDNFQTDLRKLSPDQKSCAGVAEQEPVEKSSELETPTPSELTPSEEEQATV